MKEKEAKECGREIQCHKLQVPKFSTSKSNNFLKILTFQSNNIKDTLTCPKIIYLLPNLKKFHNNPIASTSKSAIF
jgi:hypothetical protein